MRFYAAIICMFWMTTASAVGIAGTVASVDTGLGVGVVTFGLNMNPLPAECQNKYHFNNRDSTLNVAMWSSWLASNLNPDPETNPDLGRLSITLDDAAATDGIVNTCVITRARTAN